MHRHIFRAFVWLCTGLALIGCGSQSASTVDSTVTASDTIAPAPTAAGAAAATPTDTALEEAATEAPPAEGPVALRDDIQLRKVIETGGGFVRLELDPLTEALHYLNSQGEIFRLDLQPGEGSTGTRVYGPGEIGGASMTTGMAFGPDGTLYVVGNSSEDTTTQATIRKGTPDDAGERTWTTLAATVPYPKSNTQYDHLVNGIVADPDGRYVYVNSGSRTEHGEVQSNGGAFPDTREVPLTSAIFRLPADGEELELTNDEAALKAQGYLFVDGLRNAYDLAFAPNGDLFATENGPDADLPDELNWIREGHHYGFPWRFGNEENPQTRPDYDPSQDRRLSEDFVAVREEMYHNDPDFPPAPTAFTDPVKSAGPDADQYRDLEGNLQDASEQGQPIYTFTPHRSPLGLSFDVEGALDTFEGDAFVLSWGAAGGTLTDRGEDLLHLDLTKSGDAYEATVTQIARNFANPIDSVLIDNKLYVLEYGGEGGIWEVILP